MMEPQTSGDNDAFYRLGGTIGRKGFFLNSLILAALFGASFAFITLGGYGQEQLAATPQWKQIPPLQLFLYALVAGATIGPFFVLLLGMTSLLYGFLFTLMFTYGSVISVSTFGLKQTLANLTTGGLLTVMFLLACGNVFKRMRDLLGFHRKATVASIVVLLLSLIPLLGTVLYALLLFWPPKKSGPL